MPWAPGESDVRWPLMWMTFLLELNASSPSVAPDADRMVACPTAPFPTPPDILEWHATSAAPMPAMTAIPAFTMTCLCDCQAKHKPDSLRCDGLGACDGINSMNAPTRITICLAAALAAGACASSSSTDTGLPQIGRAHV